MVRCRGLAEGLGYLLETCLHVLEFLNTVGSLGLGGGVDKAAEGGLEVLSAASQLACNSISPFTNSS